MDQNELAACLAAAQDDVARIFKDYQVPEEYRTRLVAYIQRWYLDQGGEERLCLLQPSPGAPAVA
jgi:hypothetical protein